MLSERLLPTIVDYVNRDEFKSSLFLHGRVKVQFLAQGEYNLNFLLETTRGKLVLRVNTASQMQWRTKLLMNTNPCDYCRDHASHKTLFS
jgi:hypothetical protein